MLSEDLQEAARLARGAAHPGHRVSVPGPGASSAHISIFEFKAGIVREAVTPGMPA